MQALLWKLGQIGLVFVSTRLRRGCLRGNIGTVDARRLQALCQGFFDFRFAEGIQLVLHLSLTAQAQA